MKIRTLIGLVIGCLPILALGCEPPSFETRPEKFPRPTSTILWPSTDWPETDIYLEMDDRGAIFVTTKKMPNGWSTSGFNKLADYFSPGFTGYVFCPSDDPRIRFVRIPSEGEDCVSRFGKKTGFEVVQYISGNTQLTGHCTAGGCYLFGHIEGRPNYVTVRMNLPVMIYYLPS